MHGLLRSIRIPLLTLLLTASVQQGVFSQESGSLLRRRARLESHSVTVEVALHQLTEQSGVPITFDAATVSGTGVVSCSCTDVPLQEALERILNGTGLGFVETANGIIVGPSGDATRLRVVSRAVHQGATVVGIVLSSADSQPVFGARIQVAGRLGELRTDRAGWFDLSLPPGSYDLTVRALAYAPVRLRDIQISAQGHEPLTVLMTPAPLRLSEIVVTPSTYGIMEAQVVAIPQTRSLEELSTYPHFGDDLYRSVNRLPGLATHDIKAKLHVRGSPDDQVLYLLDGLELYEPFHLKDVDGALSIIDVESVSDVELATGGFTAEYGDKLAGVFSMKTTTPPPDRIKTTLGLSLMNATFKNEGSFANGRGTWLLSARRGYLDFLLKLMEDSSTISPTYYDAFTKLQYQVSSNHLLSGHVLYAGDKWTGRDDDDWTQTESNWSSAYAWLSWDADFSSSLSAATILSAGRLTRERHAMDWFGNQLEDRGMPEFDANDRSSFDFAGLKQNWSYLASERFLLRWGFDLKTGIADYDYFMWKTSFVPNMTDGSGPNYWIETDTTSIVRRPRGQEASLYLSNRIRFAAPLTAELGLRYDFFSHTDNHTLGPRLNVAYQATPTTTLRGAWGLYHQSHGLQELFVADGDPRFYPTQRAEHRILGVEQVLPHGVQIRVEAYERRTPDPRVEYRTPIPELEQVPEESVDERLRLEPTQSLARGLELLVKRETGQRIAWNVSYALAIAEDEIDGEWIPRPFDQRHTFRAELLFRPTGSWSFSWAFQYHSGWPMTVYNYNTFTLATGTTAIGREYGPLNAARLPAYARMDARVARYFSLGRGRLSVFLDMFNLLDRRNAESLDYEAHFINGSLTVDETYSPMLGMLPTFGVRWEF